MEGGSACFAGAKTGSSKYSWENGITMDGMYAGNAGAISRLATAKFYRLLVELWN